MTTQIPVDTDWVDPGYVASRRRYIIGSVGGARTLSRLVSDSASFAQAATTKTFTTGWDAYGDSVSGGGTGPLIQAWWSIPIWTVYDGYYAPSPWAVPDSYADYASSDRKYYVIWEDDPSWYGVTIGNRAFPWQDPSKWGHVEVFCDFDIIGTNDSAEVWLDPLPVEGPHNAAVTPEWFPAFNNDATSHGFATNDDLANLCTYIETTNTTPLHVSVGTDTSGGTPYVVDSVGNYRFGLRVTPASQRALAGPTDWAMVCSLGPANGDGGNWYNNVYYDTYWKCSRYKRVEFLTCGLQVTPPYGYGPLVVTASCPNAQATDIGGPFVSFIYDWGDGSPVEVTTDKSTTLTHTYTATGWHTITCVAQDAAGNTDTAYTSVDVVVDLRPDLANVGGDWRVRFE